MLRRVRNRRRYYHHYYYSFFFLSGPLRVAASTNDSHKHCKLAAKQKNEAQY